MRNSNIFGGCTPSESLGNRPVDFIKPDRKEYMSDAIIITRCARDVFNCYPVSEFRTNNSNNICNLDFYSDTYDDFYKMKYFTDGLLRCLEDNDFSFYDDSSRDIFRRSMMQVFKVLDNKSDDDDRMFSFFKEYNPSEIKNTLFYSALNSLCYSKYVYLDRQKSCYTFLNKGKCYYRLAELYFKYINVPSET